MQEHPETPEDSDRLFVAHPLMFGRVSTGRLEIETQDGTFVGTFDDKSWIDIRDCA
jgi:hypothetical protein